MSVFLKNFIFPASEKKGFDPMSLVLLGERGAENGKPGPWEAINFKQALYSEIVRYRQDPWRLSDVKEI
jgi:hypothetical protein